MKYKLVNAEERARKSMTFKIPPIERRTKLPTNGFAKLIFTSEDGADAERMWVRVKLATVEQGGLLYRGVLENSGAVLPLEAGLELVFGPEHVIDIMHPLVEG